MNQNALKHGPALRAAGIISPRPSESDMFPRIEAALHDAKGYRFDLRLNPSGSHRRDGLNCLEATYNPAMGDPSPEDLQALVAEVLPGKEIVFPEIMRINAQHMRVGDTTAWLSVPVQAREDRIVVANASRVPEGFVHVASGIYCKADGSAPGVRWRLEKDANEGGGMALVRIEDEPSMGDFERRAMALANRPKIGQPVTTPDGRGVLVARTAEGQPVVNIGGRRFAYHEAQVERVQIEDPGAPPNFKPGEFDPGRERSYSTRFFAEAYGDRPFAEALNSDFGRARAN